MCMQVIYSEKCKLGCGITAVNSTLLFTGNTTFLKNNARCIYCAGAIWASASSLNFTGNNNFIGNSGGYGGAIRVEANTLKFSGTSDFSTCSNHVLIFRGTTNFSNNSAKRGGGALFASASTSTNFIGASTFTHNSAGSRGGAIITSKAVLTFTGTTNFSNNSANDFGGGAICTLQSRISFNGINIFMGNSASHGGAIFVLTTSLSLTGTSSFSNSSAKQGGAIFANSASKLTFDGNISFINNGHNMVDSRGGAVYLASIRYLFILSGTTVHWENNHANLGGAIYVFNSNPIFYCTVTRISDLLLYRLTRKSCFFQLPGWNTNGSGFKKIDVKLAFKNNSADAAGSVLYGGAIDKCKLHGLGSGEEVFKKIAQYEADNMTSTISSDPFRVCPCDVDNQPDCNKSKITKSVYPGETFQVSLVTVGQMDGIVPSAVKSRTDRGRLLHSQYIQQTSKICTKLNYTVFSQQNVSLELHPDGMCSTVN